MQMHVNGKTCLRQANKNWNLTAASLSSALIQWTQRFCHTFVYYNPTKKRMFHRINQAEKCTRDCNELFVGANCCNYFIIENIYDGYHVIIFCVEGNRVKNFSGWTQILLPELICLVSPLVFLIRLLNFVLSWSTVYPEGERQKSRSNSNMNAVHDTFDIIAIYYYDSSNLFFVYAFR